ncbi:MAG: N-acetyltransferase [Segetibacter sp.]|nr:N-acetyltransferase [Segetibacter sp.]
MLSLVHITYNSTGLEEIKVLFKEYALELNENLCFQSFDAELEDPLKKYGPPNGSLVLAYWDEEPAGCIALQALKEDGICEMKRLFVRPAFRNFGIGNKLVEQIIANANKLGYKKMVLDTLERLTAALKLYQHYGFVNTSAYYANPLPGVVYLEKRLTI